MKLDTLDALNDNELNAVIGRAHELLATRDEERKGKALAEARALLAAVGLTPEDLAGRSKGGKRTNGKAPAYHAGHQYQHPVNKALVWNAKGQKPNWLRELEAQGGKATQLLPQAANDNAPQPLKKAM